MKVVLVGECAPRGGEPLDPRAPNGSGSRLYELVSDKVSVEEFARAFGRVNVCAGPTFDADEARAFASAAPADWRGATAVLLGGKVARAFGQKFQPICLPRIVSGGFTVRTLPHPSGLDRWYNDAANRALAAELLYELYLATCAS